MTKLYSLIKEGTQTYSVFKITSKLYILCRRTLWARIAVEFQWLEHLWDYENMFETGVVRANEC